ncbi:Cation efflux family protein [compost metagenome]
MALWARGLLRDTGRVLLDAEMDAPVVEEIRAVVAQLPVPASITDLHVWRVGKDQYACILGLAARAELSADSVRQALGVHEELAHITVEVNRLA